MINLNKDDLTKELRHQIYKIALEFYMKDFDAQIGLCSSISSALRNLYGINYSDTINPYDHMDCYPEIIKHMPPTKKWNNNYWFTFSDENIQKRIDILNEAITLTEN